MQMKRSLLVSYAPHMFREGMEPLIYELAKRFRIVITILDDCVPPGLTELLASWKREGVIEEFLVIPPYGTLNLHLFMKKAIENLKSYNFDVWLSISEISIHDRYILECVLSNRCIRILVGICPTCLLFNEGLVRKLLAGTEAGNYLAPAVITASKKHSRFRNLTEKIREAGSFPNVLKKLLRRIYTYVINAYRIPMRKFHIFCDRVLFPWLIVKKTFRFGPYDQLTQLGSGRSDVIIFCDEIDAEAHRILLRTPSIYTAHHPNYGSCHCNGDKTGKAAVLSPLTAFVGQDQIPQKALQIFFRDFKTVVSQTGAEIIHLRPHPRVPAKWQNQLRDYLINRGIDTIVVDCDRPIREIACDYVCVAGFLSTALRDARAACDYISVVGFAGISRWHFSNPQFTYGKSEGIGWIEVDGSYNPDIFSVGRYVPPPRKSISQIVTDLSRTHEHNANSDIQV